MKRYVSVAGEAERALGWSGNCGEGVLHAPEGDVEVRARLAADGAVALRLGERVYRVEPAGPGRLRVNGREVPVELRSELEHRFAGFGAAGGEEAGRALRVPMPGRVVRVLVAPGDEVAKGQGLVIVEAMKMENELKAPRSGRVAAVHVAAGAGVEKGALLVEFE